MEIKHLTEKVAYVPNPVNIGVVRAEKSSVLIDSGIDESVPRKVSRLLEKPPLFLINTHSHADHCGGNTFLKKRFSTRVFAPELEKEIIENTILEPFYLYGAFPPEELRNKFLMAKPSKVDETLKEGTLTLDGVKLEIVFLPGHSPNQIGVAVENVLFCADSVFSEEAIEKHRIFVVYNVTDFLETLDFLEKTNYDYYVPSHGEVTQNIVDLARKNRNVVENVINEILEILKTPFTLEELMKKLFDRFSITIENLTQYVLYRSTVQAYLSFLLDRGEIEREFKENTLLWRRV
ncbi:MBL fold metallo-hydrolase [Thermotoga sp. SG1]|uniref:MBL fold metallo-hydrolase n=1 Tax=Thermotoga sp. SG1 TaxID=126739 RepID=UPI000C767901|nr:MBL fold metallo-hydrolase [Thermotoga sp. SG1]PLV56734.1 MBL fold metallo-hydrolase [Thermotoga sp. SG1]